MKHTELAPLRTPPSAQMARVRAGKGVKVTGSNLGEKARQVRKGWVGY